MKWANRHDIGAANPNKELWCILNILALLWVAQKYFSQCGSVLGKMGAIGVLVGSLMGPHVGQLDLKLCITSLWSVLGSFGSSQGIIRWTRWFLPVGGWTGPPRDYLGQGGFSQNFGLRLNFAVADYLSETLRCNNMTSHWGQVVGEPWALLFSKKKAKIWCKNSQKILFWHCFPTIKLTLGAYFNIYMYKFGTSSLISP